MKGENRFSGST